MAAALADDENYDELLQVAYSTLGLLPYQVFEMTPNELHCLMLGAGKKKDEEVKLNYHLAWHIAAFVGGLFAGKLPDLNELLSTTSKPKQVNEEVEETKIFAMFEAMKHSLKDDEGNSLISVVKH